jgi:hypothetical protein
MIVHGKVILPFTLIYFTRQPLAGEPYSFLPVRRQGGKLLFSE